MNTPCGQNVELWMLNLAVHIVSTVRYIQWPHIFKGIAPPFIIIIIMELGHLLTRSGLTYLEVSSEVCHDSFCQLGNSVSLSWAVCHEAFCLHVVSSSSCIPAVCLEPVLFLIPLQCVNLFCNLSKCTLLFFSYISSLLLLFSWHPLLQQSMFHWPPFIYFQFRAQFGSLHSIQNIFKCRHANWTSSSRRTSLVLTSSAVSYCNCSTHTGDGDKYPLILWKQKNLNTK